MLGARIGYGWLTEPRGTLATVAAAAAILGAPQGLQAQQPTPGAWRFLARANVDLWNHGLATVGYEGFVPMLPDDRGYAGRIESLQRVAGVFPAPLDTLAGGVHTAFSQDSTFEVLHLLPLYFGLSDVGDMLDAIERVADGDEPTDFGSGIVASVFRTAASGGCSHSSSVPCASSGEGFIDRIGPSRGRSARTRLARISGYGLRNSLPCSSASWTRSGWPAESSLPRRPWVRKGGC